MDFRWVKRLASWISIKIYGTEDMEESSNWLNLPDTMLLEVYSYLPDTDRYSMCQVCRNWYRIFRTPCLWRSRSYDLGGYSAEINGQKANEFAAIFGKYLKSLTLTCSHPSYTTNKIVLKSLEEFFEQIQDKCKLTEFHLPRLELDRFWRGEDIKSKIGTALTKFLRHQDQMLYFDMTQAQFTLTAGCKVLEAIGTKAKKVRELEFQDFFHPRIAVFQIKRFKRAIARFTNLRSVSLNYNCISDEILDIMTVNLCGKLEYFNIKVHRSDPHFQRMSSYAWKEIKRACPKLQVDVWFECIGNSMDIVPVLVPDMPVEVLHIWTGYDDDSDWQLGDTLRHVATVYNSSLRELSLELDNNHELVDEALVNLLEKCKKLRDLNVNASLLIATIEIICQQQVEKKINLKSFHLTCCNMTEIEYAELLYYKDKYLPGFQEQGLDYRLKSDLVVDNL